MKAKILVRVDRDDAMEAILTLDALSTALQAHESQWPKRLRRRYKKTRHTLIRATGLRAYCSGISEATALD